jgi:hypothetical protein
MKTLWTVLLVLSTAVAALSDGVFLHWALWERSRHTEVMGGLLLVYLVIPLALLGTLAACGLSWLLWSRYGSRWPVGLLLAGALLVILPQLAARKRQGEEERWQRIHAAVRERNAGALKLLLQRGDESAPEASVLAMTVGDTTDRSVIDALLEAGFEKELLAAAVSNRSDDLLGILFSRGTPCRGLGEEKDSPLYFAARDGDLRIVKLLLECRARAQPGGQRLADDVFLAAVWSESFEMMKLLVEHRARCTGLDAGGANGLHLIAERWDRGGPATQAQAVRWLVEHQVDPNLPDSRGRLPLHVAVEKGKVGVAAALVAHGADPRAKGGRTESPLEIAKESGGAEMVRALTTRTQASK